MKLGDETWRRKVPFGLKQTDRVDNQRNYYGMTISRNTVSDEK
jgi:hypothetical protein